MTMIFKYDVVEWYLLFCLQHMLFSLYKQLWVNLLMLKILDYKLDWISKFDIAIVLYLFFCIYLYNFLALSWMKSALGKATWQQTFLIAVYCILMLSQTLYRQQNIFCLGLQQRRQREPLITFPAKTIYWCFVVLAKWPHPVDQLGAFLSFGWS